MLLWLREVIEFLREFGKLVGLDNVPQIHGNEALCRNCYSRRHHDLPFHSVLWSTRKNPKKCELASCIEERHRFGTAEIVRQQHG